MNKLALIIWWLFRILYISFHVMIGVIMAAMIAAAFKELGWSKSAASIVSFILFVVVVFGLSWAYEWAKERAGK